MKLYDLLETIGYYDGELSTTDEDMDMTLVYDKGMMKRAGEKEFADVLEAEVTQVRLKQGDNWIEIEADADRTNRFIAATAGYIPESEYNKYFQ